MNIESIEVNVQVMDTECQGDIITAEKLVLKKAQEVTFFHHYKFDTCVFDHAGHDSFYFIVTFM